MFKLCRLWLEEEADWQKEKIEVVVHFSNLSNKGQNNWIEGEKIARTLAGEERGMKITEIAAHFIKKYYPEYTELSEQFGSTLRIERVNQEEATKINTIINNCLDGKYGYLKQGSDDFIEITGEGRELANRPYIWITRDMPVSIGLMKAYYKALGPFWGICVTIASAMVLNSYTIYTNWDNIVEFFIK